MGRKFFADFAFSTLKERSNDITSIDNFETASLPTTTPEERKRLLSFVVCGGGPTGVETAAVLFILQHRDLHELTPEMSQEIYDFCQEDITGYVSFLRFVNAVTDLATGTLSSRQYPKICRREVSIHVIQSREHILNTVRGRRCHFSDRQPYIKYSILNLLVNTRSKNLNVMVWTWSPQHGSHHLS